MCHYRNRLIKPGRSAWSWWSDAPSTYEYLKQIEYINFAASMGWGYILLDAGWHRMAENELGLYHAICSK